MQEVQDRLYVLEKSLDQLIDNQQMLMDGVQIVVHGQTKVDARVDSLIRDQAQVRSDLSDLGKTLESSSLAFTSAVAGFAKEMRWMRVTVFVVLLAVVAVAASHAKPAKAMIAAVVP